MSLLNKDPRRAPKHLVQQIARTYAAPRRIQYSDEQNQQAHLAQARLLADSIWAEAFVAGATQGATWASTPRMIVMDPANLPEEWRP